MGRMIKTISLPPYLYDKANEMRNFSGWVQARLEEEGNIVHNDSCRPIPEFGICNGIRKPTCGQCYPHGAPNKTEWLSFREHQDQERMQIEIQKRISGFVDLSEKHKQSFPKKRKGLLKRLKSAFLAFKN